MTSFEVRITQNIPVVSISQLWATQYIRKQEMVFVPREKEKTHIATKLGAHESNIHRWFRLET